MKSLFQLQIPLHFDADFAPAGGVLRGTSIVSARQKLGLVIYSIVHLKTPRKGGIQDTKSVQSEIPATQRT